MNEQTFINLLTFWRNVEALSPQEIPKTDPEKKTDPVRNWGSDIPPPWNDIKFRERPIPSNKEWRHTVYAAVYERQHLTELLEKPLGRGSDVYDEGPGGHSCVFTIAIDELGRPMPETMMIGMAAWAFGIIDSNGLDSLSDSNLCDTSGLHTPKDDLNVMPSDSGFPGFDTQLDRLRKELAWRLENLPAEKAVDLVWFNEFVSLALKKLKIGHLSDHDPMHRVKSVQIRRPKKGEAEPKIPQRSEDDFLNSFFIKDLGRVIHGGYSHAGESLLRYMEPPANPLRTDVRKERKEVLRTLSPSNFPEGCWPAEHPLVWSQQVALNAIWKDLRDGGCFAVNGPPGTGKTTLLRDIVAAIIVERAKILASRGAGIFGNRRTIDVGSRTIPYYLFDKELKGFSIVVASSNNGAVENVTLELPREKAIHDIWAKETDVYPDIAGELLGEPAWALIAGKLGNKGNRTDFVNTFWWQKGSEENKVGGLRERLDAIKLKKRSHQIPWKDAVDRFKEAASDEKGWRDRIVKLADLPEKLSTLENKRKETTENRKKLDEKLDAISSEIKGLDDQITDVLTSITPLEGHVRSLRAAKPGLFEWFLTLGKTHREWRGKLRKAENDLESQKKFLDGFKKNRANNEQVLSGIKKEVNKLDLNLGELNISIIQTKKELDGGRLELGRNWPDLTAHDEDLERSNPWAHPKWREARIRLFLAAMNLHRAFIEENADKMMANLGLAMDMLQGGIPDPKVRALALESLALVCPVISTTFASVPTVFGDLEPKSIGWLLIDEAGQATPQAAVGAIWRSLRAVVVGDPLQLEPVVTIPRSTEASLAARNGGLDNRWHPSRTSVQRLADQSTPLGTMVGAGEEAIWVGAPLRVHRRCDNPMFSVSNSIAYGGMMVHQKRPLSSSWPGSAWIDVPTGQSNSNWISEEGEALQDLLRNLIINHRIPAKDIFLISPFRDVVRELKTIGKTFSLDDGRVGTVHTTQGKEADVVIMVLGGGKEGARKWAALKPNLLNVAVSRAKERLYVVGNRSNWGKLKYFDILAKELSHHL